MYLEMNQVNVRFMCVRYRGAWPLKRWHEMEYCNLYTYEYISGYWKSSIINSDSSFIIDMEFCNIFITYEVTIIPFKGCLKRSHIFIYNGNVDFCCAWWTRLCNSLKYCSVTSYIRMKDHSSNVFLLLYQHSNSTFFLKS